MYCHLCYHKMLPYPADLSFFIYERKVNIKNYPFYVCPQCAEIQIKRKDMKKTISFLKKNGEKISFISDFKNSKGKK